MIWIRVGKPGRRDSRLWFPTREGTTSLIWILGVGRHAFLRVEMPDIDAQGVSALVYGCYMCVTAMKKAPAGVSAPEFKPYPYGDAVMEIKINIPVFELDGEQVDNVDLTITNHNLRRDYVVIQKGGLSLTISSSDMERAIQAARLAHKI